MAPNAPAPQPSPIGSELNSVMGQLSRGEQLVAAGGLLALVLAELILGALLGGGGIGITSVLASTTILVAIYLRHSARQPLMSAHLYGVTLVVLAALVAVPALADLLQTLHVGFGGEAGLDILFELVYWVGAAVMMWGAIVHWRAVASS